LIYFVASPFGVTKRRRWTEEERNAIFKQFQKEITCLNNRSVAQIKTWIHNYISGKIKRH